jgi:hypothetical protein
VELLVVSTIIEAFRGCRTLAEIFRRFQNSDEITKLGFLLGGLVALSGLIDLLRSMMSRFI